MMIRCRRASNAVSSAVVIFTLCSFLAFAIGGQSKRQLERLGKQGWRKPQGGGAQAIIGHS